jgi:hypothetical protein
MNMIGHQTIGPHFYRCLVATFCEQAAIERVVRRFKENLLAAIAALRHMMRKQMLCRLGQALPWN